MDGHVSYRHMAVTAVKGLNLPFLLSHDIYITLRGRYQRFELWYITDVTEYQLMSPENLNVPITGMHSYEEEEEEEDAMEGDVPGDNEVNEESLII